MQDPINWLDSIGLLGIHGPVMVGGGDTPTMQDMELNFQNSAPPAPAWVPTDETMEKASPFIIVGGT